MKKFISLLTAAFITASLFTSCRDTKDTSNSEVIPTEEYTEVQTTEATSTTQIETTTSIQETTSYETDEIIINGKPNGKMLVPGITPGMTSDEFFEKVNVEYDSYHCQYDDYVAEGSTFADNDEERLHVMQIKEYTYVLDSTTLFDLNDYCSFFYVSFDYMGILDEYGYNIGYRLDNDGNGEFCLTDDEMKPIYEKVKTELNKIYGDGNVKQDYIDDYGFNIGCFEWKETEIGDIILGAGTKLWDVEGYKGVMIFIDSTTATNSAASDKPTFGFTIDEFVKEFNSNAPTAFGNERMLLKKINEPDGQYDDGTTSCRYEFLNGTFTIAIRYDSLGYVRHMTVGSDLALQSANDTDEALGLMIYMLSPYIVINKGSQMTDILNFIGTMKSEGNQKTVAYKGDDSYAQYTLESGDYFGSTLTIYPIA